MTDQLVGRMLALSVARDRDALAKNAQSLSEDAARIAKDADRAVRNGSVDQLMPTLQAMVKRANRLSVLLEMVELQEADSTQGGVPDGALERAKAEARRMLSGLAPGNTGTNIADEVAEKIIAAIFTDPGKS